MRCRGSVKYMYLKETLSVSSDKVRVFARRPGGRAGVQLKLLMISVTMRTNEFHGMTWFTTATVVLNLFTPEMMKLLVYRRGDQQLGHLAV